MPAVPSSGSHIPHHCWVPPAAIGCPRLNLAASMSVQLLQSFVGPSTFVVDLLTASALGFHRGVMAPRQVAPLRVGETCSPGTFESAAARSVLAIAEARRALAAPPHSDMLANCSRMVDLIRLPDYSELSPALVATVVTFDAPDLATALFVDPCVPPETSWRELSPLQVCSYTPADCDGLFTSPQAADYYYDTVFGAAEASADEVMTFLEVGESAEVSLGEAQAVALGPSLTHPLMWSPSTLRPQWNSARLVAGS